MSPAMSDIQKYFVSRDEVHHLQWLATCSIKMASSDSDASASTSSSRQTKRPKICRHQSCPASWLSLVSGLIQSVI